MSGPSLIYDPNAGGNVEARLEFAADGLTVFGPNGRKLHHWPYGEIIHAFPKDRRKDRHLAHAARPELTLQVPYAAVYDAIATRAPQLRRRPPIDWREIWGMVPEEFQLVVFLALFGGSAAGVYLLFQLIG